MLAITRFHTAVLGFVSFIILHTGELRAQSQQKWYKGNLHTHSYWSDGDEFPEMIVDWYKTHGYQFVALSDHNILADGEKWITVPRGNMYEKSFKKYREKYGDRWVVHNTDSGRINVKLKKYSEYKPLFEDKNFLIIKSEEITDRSGDKHIHMNATNVQTLIAPQGGKSVTEVMQRNVDAVLKQRKETGVPMILHLNHPNFFYSVSVQDIIDLHGERFFEVYNGHPLVNNYGDSLHPGTENMWDIINVAYSNRGQPLLLGLATDDSHNYHQFGSAYANAGRGWVMIRSRSLTADSLVTALERGDFYASTGVTLDQLELQNQTLKIKVKAEPGVSYTIAFIGLKTGEKQTGVLIEVKGTEASFPLSGDLQFVRARVTSTKVKENPFKDKEVEMAWTQPVRAIRND